MKISKKLRFLKADKIVSEKGNFFTCTFLDEEDDKFNFFVNEDFYNKCLRLKKYDTIDVDLTLYMSKKGRYGLGVL